MLDILYTDCTLATMMAGGPAYGCIHQAAIAIEKDTVSWFGPRAKIPSRFSHLPQESLNGRLVTPSLIDCHTHLIFGGNRAHEFERRLNGATYEEIARAGGGILSTVTATRHASDEDLMASALIRVDALMAEGVAVIEIKSGYGLTIDDEIRMLRLARRLGDLRPIKIVTSWLAAHAIPPEYKTRADDYIDNITIAGLRQAAAEGLVDAVDGFCENIAFTPSQIERLFMAAQDLGLPVKLHAEQLSDQKGALLAARYKALSADHLEHLADVDVETFAASGAVAVLLPGAFYYLNESKLPPIKALRNNRVDIAIATDCNPGSSPISSILTAMNMACVQFGLTPEEALAGVTRCAAKALGLGVEYGVIEEGRKAELAVWDVDHPAELSYWVGGSPLFKSISQRLTS